MLLPLPASLALLAAAVCLTASRPLPIRRASTGTAWFYTGRHAAEVQYLLTRVDGWTLPSSETDENMSPPRVPLNPNSTQRDAHVAAAAMKAWAVEGYAKLGKTDQAVAMAEQVHADLKDASDLCSDAPAVSASGMTPATLKIWPCPAPIKDADDPSDN